MNLSPAMTRLALTVAGGVAVIGLAWRTAYVVDCRRSGGALEACWERGPLAISLDDAMKLATVLGAGGAAGWIGGFNTYNPALREPTRPRDPDA